MAKFEVGQDVRVKSEDFLKIHRYEQPKVIDGMFYNAGKIIKIQRISAREEYVRYKANGYWWDESWLESIIEIDTDSIMSLLDI